MDADLKKPKHDEIMLWLRENISDVIQTIDAPLSEYDRSQLEESARGWIQQTIACIKPIQKNASVALSNLLNKDAGAVEQPLTEEFTEQDTKRLEYMRNWNGFENIPNRPRSVVQHTTWELPITNHSNTYESKSSKYPIGFVDMAVSYTLYKPHVTGFKTSGHGQSILTEIANKIGVDFSGEHQCVYIEVKTEIPSLGELIRQIQLYKEYNPGRYFVLAPDDSYRDVLSEQRIGFIQYPAWQKSSNLYA